MAQWEPLIGGIFGSEILNPLSSAIDAVQSVLGPIQTILSLIQSILSIIRIFLIDAASLLLAVIQTLVDEITKFIDSLANAGVYYLAVGLQGGATQSDYVANMTGGFNKFVQKIVDSFDDAADPQRPTFSSSERCGGVIYALSSGNISDAISFMGMFLRQAKQVFSALYVPPNIQGFSANQTNLIVFERPNVPQNFFSNITFKVQRAKDLSGTAKTKTEKNEASGKTSVEASRDPQNPGLKLSDWVDIASITETLGDAFTLSPQRYVIVDGQDATSAHLIKFDLTKKASTRASVNPNSPKQGPSSFTLRDASGVAGNIMGNLVVSNRTQIEKSIPSGSQGDFFKAKFLPANSTASTDKWIDFRVNGYSLPTSKEQANGGLYVTSFDGSTVSLSSNVPLGSKVIAYTYVEAKSADIVLQQDLNAGHSTSTGSLYTKVLSSSTANDVQNNQPYFYRVVIKMSDGSDAPGGTSNTIKLTPRASTSPTPPPAYCLSGKRGPFVIPPGQNTLSFSVGTRTYNVALRPSRLNVFSNEAEFYNGFGMTLAPQFQTTTSASDLTGTSLATTAANVISGAKGLVFEYLDYDLNTHIVLPGSYIPVEVDDILMDLETQCNDGNVSFFAQGGRIGIQDMSARSSKSSSVIINSGLANSILGFTVGPCMSVSFSEPPDWGRIAVKDIFPGIYDLAEIVQSFANGIISGIESGVKSLVDFIDLLSTKIATIQTFLNQINNLLNTLKNLKLQLPNMYKLKIPAGNGVDYLKTTINSATARPASSPNDLTVGFVLIIGGPFTDAILPLLFKLL